MADPPWETLVAGLPATADGSIDSLTNQVDPIRVLDGLLTALTGVSELERAPEEEEEIPRESLTTRGATRAGTAGYRWERWRSLDSSMFDVVIRVETFGLDGLDLEWELRYEKVGQFGHALFKSGPLRVQFRDHIARETLHRAWIAVVGLEPAFAV